MKPLDGQFALYLFLILIAACVSQFAEFGYIKYAKSWSVYAAIAAALGVALVEYSFSVNANRIGDQYLSVNQLQVVWNFIQVTSFAFLLKFYFQEPTTWETWTGLATMIIGATLILHPWRSSQLDVSMKQH